MTGPSSDQEDPTEYEETDGKENGNETGYVEAADVGPLTDYIPQSLVATHPLVYGDMDFGASAIYCYPGGDCDSLNEVENAFRGPKRKRTRTLKAVVTSVGVVDIHKVVVSDTVDIRAAGRLGSKIRGTGLFRIKPDAPSCEIKIQCAEDTSVETDTIVVDNDPDS